MIIARTEALIAGMGTNEASEKSIMLMKKQVLVQF